jgi:predicted DNA-binding transcriptional regulator YafY
LNDIPLTENDLESIRFAASTLMQFKDVSMFKNFSFAIDKIFDRVHISDDPREKDIQHLVQFEAATSTRGNEYLAPILEAIRKRQIIHFEYESFQTGKKKPRRVVPLLLKEYRNRWYTISYDCMKEALMTYALERIDQLELTPEFFTQPIEFNPEHFFKNAIGITANENQAETIVFKADNIAAKYIHSQPLHHSQKIVKEGKNKTTFSIDVLISEELIRTLLSFGGEIEVVEPSHFRQTLAKRVAQMMENYGL